MLLIAWLSTAGMAHDSYEDSEARALTEHEEVLMASAGFEEVSWIIPGRCAMCHAREPSYPGIHYAPRDVLLETPADIARAARVIYLQSGVTHAMPPANVSYMEEDERAIIRNWYRGATGPGLGLALN